MMDDYAVIAWLIFLTIITMGLIWPILGVVALVGWIRKRLKK
jgi:hypothetical protein